MLKHYTVIRNTGILFSMFIFTGLTGLAQKTKRLKPVWWFGESIAANFNYYRGTTQMLNDQVTTPTAFHKGKGVKPYFSVLTEYRPGKVLGGMLNVAYDNRGAKFDAVVAPCNCPANLSTNISYITIEPSLRVAPFASAFYLYAGPTINFNLTKKFDYTQEKQPDTRGDWSDIRKTTFSGQVGAGIDIPLSAKTSATQVTLSPFASFLTDFGHEPRSVESWSFYSVRAGVAIKLGTARKHSTPEPVQSPAVISAAVVEKDIQFSVRAPKIVPVNRQVKEIFPLRNSVFFDLGSTQIPSRYILLSSAQAQSFKEQQLQETQPANLNNGRSSRQLAVYYNILNIIGDRLRSNPQSAILLTGSSENDPVQGRLLAENVKQYLVNVFAILPARIKTDGRSKPLIPSEQPGSTNNTALLREGDRRVDIESVSPELLMQVGGRNSSYLKPVQITALQSDPLDSHLLLTAAGAGDLMNSWSVAISDEQGHTVSYGPYTHDQASIPAKTILGDNKQGNYSILMTGQTKSGHAVRKESSVTLIKMDDRKQDGLRYSVLFDFDQSKTIVTYEKFLTEIVTPLIPANGTVIIHGHTDIIGDENYNIALSRDRANDARQIIEKALIKAEKKGVKFETYGFGEDESIAPFENNYPEKRFYNRTVIIDIIQGN